MATKRSVSTLTLSDLKGKRVFVRVDLNVPLDDNLNITDDTRIRAAVPTIKYLMEHDAKVILSSHLGRPKGVTPKYSLKPLVPRLSELLGVEVKMANDCIGEEVEKLVAGLPEGGVLLLENVRFHKEEEKNDPEFAKKLASLADLYVNDAFGSAHRAHASTEGVAKYLKPSVAGFLMQKMINIPLRGALLAFKLAVDLRPEAGERIPDFLIRFREVFTAFCQEHKPGLWLDSAEARSFLFMHSLPDRVPWAGLKAKYHDIIFGDEYNTKYIFDNEWILTLEYLHGVCKETWAKWVNDDETLEWWPGPSTRTPQIAIHIESSGEATTRQSQPNPGVGQHNEDPGEEEDPSEGNLDADEED